MLISYSVENFRSIAEQITINFVASPERNHQHHVLPLPGRKNFRVLRAAAIYGANSSGKSNIINSLDYLKDLVDGTGQLDDISKNALLEGWMDKPSKFEITFYLSRKVYTYVLHIGDGIVLLEELREIDSRFNESLIFTRTYNKRKDNYIFNLGEEIAKKLNQEDELFYKFVARATESTSLLAREAKIRKLKHLSVVHDWFEGCLAIILPESAYANLELSLFTDNSFKSTYERFLSSVDTGIHSISAEVYDMEEDDKKLVDLSKKFDHVLDGKDRFSYFDYNGETKKIQILTHRRNNKSADILFSLRDESDGTARVLDLLPILAASESPRPVTFVIDEIDRSLHPLLSKKLVQMHLDGENKATQLIFTTHETYLLNLNLLRKDEIWFTEKNDNCTTIYSLYDFQPRYDKDIRKDYLLGKFGAIPFIGDPNTLNISSSGTENG